MVPWNPNTFRCPNQREGRPPRFLRHRANPDVHCRFLLDFPPKEVVELHPHLHPPNRCRVRRCHSPQPAPTAVAALPAMLPPTNPSRVHFRPDPHRQFPRLARTAAEARLVIRPPFLQGLAHFRQFLLLLHAHLAATAEEAPATRHPQAIRVAPLLLAQFPAWKEAVRRPKSLHHLTPQFARPSRAPYLGRMEAAARWGSLRWPAIPRPVRRHHCPSPEPRAEAARPATRHQKAKTSVPRHHALRLASMAVAARLAILHPPATRDDRCRPGPRQLPKAVAGPRNHPCPRRNSSRLDRYRPSPAPSEVAAPPANHLPTRLPGHLQTGCGFRATNLARSVAARSRLLPDRLGRARRKRRSHPAAVPRLKLAPNHRGDPTCDSNPAAAPLPKSSPKATSALLVR